MALALRFPHPAPEESTNGITPMMNAREVIKNRGAKRKTTGFDSCADNGANLASSSSRAELDDQYRISWPIALPAPSKPICVKMLLSPLVIQNSKKAREKNTLRGTTKMTARGSVRLSYSAAKHQETP